MDDARQSQERNVLKNPDQNTNSLSRRRCERSDQCGGFTYKGFITTDPAQKFRIFFFHFVLNFEDGVDSWNWVTYKSEKEYLRQGEFRIQFYTKASFSLLLILLDFRFENKHDPGAEKYGSGKLLHESQAQVKTPSLIVLLIVSS